MPRRTKNSKRGAPAGRRRPKMNRFRGRGDSSALRGIKQGAGRTVARPFGGISMTRYHPCHHDAFHHAHLPLPRAVGPYTVVRTTQILATMNKPLTIVGPVLDRNANKWSDICALEFQDKTKKIGDANNVKCLKFDALVNNNSWSGAQVTPSAFSIQVMNPEALQTSTGMVYIGRIRTSLKLSADLQETVLQLCNLLVSYNNPRLCAAAKLAFRGVQVDLVPFNMAELANFTALASPSFTQYVSESPNPYGFAPMFIYNPDAIKLQFLIAAEWRVRFDPSNPAQATHALHHPAPESVWAQAQHMAESVGNGVVDIADRVANVGNAVYNAAGSMYGAMRGVRALRGVSQLALM